MLKGDAGEVLKEIARIPRVFFFKQEEICMRNSLKKSLWEGLLKRNFGGDPEQFP